MSELFTVNQLADELGVAANVLFAGRVSTAGISSPSRAL